MSDTIVSTLRHFAETSSNQVFAVVECANNPATHITYERYWHEAGGVAAALHDNGIREGDVVICLGEQSSRLLYAISGCFLLGAIPSVVPHLSDKIDSHVYGQTLLTLCEVSNVVAAIVSEREYSQTASLLHRASTVRAVLIMESINPFKWTPAPNLLTDRDRTVLLQHSSGSTGVQKGVALSDGSVMDHVKTYWAEISGCKNDVIVSWLPLYHDMGLIACFLLPLLLGVPLVLQSPFEWIAKPSILLSAVHRHRGTLSWLPNFAFNVLTQRVREDELRTLDLSSWRAVINCSEPVRWSSCSAFFDRFRSAGLRENAVLACYAMAENTFAVTQSPIGEELLVDWIDEKELLSTGIATPLSTSSPNVRSMVSSGKPIRGVSLTIRTPDGRTLEDRKVGEIAIRSGYTLKSYFRRPDLSESAFDGAWFLTGDLGYTVNDHLFVCGRKKDLIIIAGVNYYPQDFESLADQVNGVKSGRTVAFGIPNERTGTEDLVLIVESEEEISEHSAIRNEIRKSISGGTECVPREVHVVPLGWLLKTSSGKIARTANKAKLLRELHGSSEL